MFAVTSEIVQKGASIVPIIPEKCERAGCFDAPVTWCVLCTRWFCGPHDDLPDGHVCLSALGSRPLLVELNARLLDDDEMVEAIKHFRPIR